MAVVMTPLSAVQVDVDTELFIHQSVTTLHSDQQNCQPHTAPTWLLAAARLSCDLLRSRCSAFARGATYETHKCVMCAVHP